MPKDIKKMPETPQERELRLRKIRHIHKYHRVWHKRKHTAPVQVWACADPFCSHYWPDHLEEQFPGKASRCMMCDQPIVMVDELLEMDEPICTPCKFKQKTGIQTVTINALDEIFGKNWDKPKE